MDQARNYHNALLAGEGHGRFLEALLHEAPGIEVTVMEQSRCMIQQSQRRLSRKQAQRIRWIPCNLPLNDARVDRCTRPFDLVATHFFLDCFPPNELQKVIGFLSEIASPKAAWLVSDFQVAPNGCKRLRSQILLWAMYRFFRVAARLPAHRLTAPSPYLKSVGFRRTQRRTFDAGFLYAELWERNGRVQSCA